MWCPEGYVTLFRIVRQFEQDALKKVARTKPEDPNPDPLFPQVGASSEELIAYVNWLLTGLFELLRTEFRACLPSGKLVVLDEFLFEWVSGDLIANTYEFGDCLGPFPQDYERRAYLSNREFTFIDTDGGQVRKVSLGVWGDLTPIAGAKLCIHQTSLPMQIYGLSSWIEGRMYDYLSNPVLGPEMPTAQMIVDARKQGRHTTKSQARLLFGQSMKHAAWEALWSEAVRLSPDLSRPGPKMIDQK